MTVSEAIEKLRTSLEGKKEQVAGLSGSFQFHLTGEGGGSFYAEAKDGKVEILEGTHPSPKVTVSMAVEDMGALLEGKLNPMAAFMQGKLKVQGDMGLALKLQNLFS